MSDIKASDFGLPEDESKPSYYSCCTGWMVSIAIGEDLDRIGYQLNLERFSGEDDAGFRVRIHTFLYRLRPSGG